ncbi:MAG: triose-phosphate isomerase [Gammaproteobacteria bacterium]|nr:triose-phosphate isomerase [Gammaproteobacteria bacterium]
MRKKLVAGNWKMHGTLASVQTLTQQILAGKKDLNCEVALFPTSIHLPIVSELLKDSDILFGAQNFYPEPSGAFTGEISLSMIKELSASMVLVGHSERRQLFGENHALIAAKFKVAVEGHFRPILCVGETRAEREAGDTENIIREQLASVVEAVSIDAFRFGVVAYEPVWAIGTGLTATPEQAQSVHAFIRAEMRQHSAPIAEGLQVLYGGSVKASNAAALFAMPDVDGALVGGASLISEEFLAICRAAR